MALMVEAESGPRDDDGDPVVDAVLWTLNKPPVPVAERTAAALAALTDLGGEVA